ncbi:MAG: uroporphyrinogen decarboxylase [Bacteroidia bacterium]|nr:uroporphyrinogen decarboxylase [Bacteroidia bacterium]
MIFRNDLLLRVARGEEVPRTPVWLMRQAGRVLPEYRAVREKAGSFIHLVKTPELAAEVTVQPVDIFGVDAAIIFSDILVIPEAMGLPYEMAEATGPRFPAVVRTQRDVELLRVADGSELKYVTDAIALVKKVLNGRVPLIGFAGAPFTLLAYMVEGKGSKTFSVAKQFLYTNPTAAHALLEKITASTLNYLSAQVEAGADIVQIFDSWAGILGPDMYREFSLRYLTVLCREIKRRFKIPVILFPKDAHFVRSEITETGCDVMSMDWTMDIAETRAMTGDRITLQGNADPCLLYASEERIVEGVVEMLRAYGPHRHIANLGHGLYPDIEKSKVKLFVDAVKDFRFQGRTG